MTSVPPERLALDFHDTYGQALANIYACLDSGIGVFDACGRGPGRLPLRERREAATWRRKISVYMLAGGGIRHRRRSRRKSSRSGCSRRVRWVAIRCPTWPRSERALSCDPEGAAMSAYRSPTARNLPFRSRPILRIRLVRLVDNTAAIFEINHRARTQRRRPERKRARSLGALERRRGDPAAKRPDTTPASAGLPTIDDNLRRTANRPYRLGPNGAIGTPISREIDPANATHHDRKHSDGTTCQRQAEATELCGPNRRDRRAKVDRNGKARI